MMILEDELLGNPFGALPIFRGELFNFRGVAGWNIHHLESMYFLLITGGFAACHVSLLEGNLIWIPSFLEEGCTPLFANKLVLSFALGFWLT